MSVPIGRARRLVKARLKTVFDTYLDAELTIALAADTWITKPLLPGLVGPEAIFLVDPDDPAKLPRNFTAFIYIYEDAPRQYDTESSGGPDGFTAMSTQDIRTVLVFQYMGEQCLDEDSNVPDVDVIMRHRAELYLDAIMQTVLKYSSEVGSPIQLSEPVEDLEVTLYSKEFTLLGVCSTLWRCSSTVLFPNAC